MHSFEAFLKTHDGGHVLDIACGSGAFAKRLITGLKSYQSVTGLDIKDSVGAEFLKHVEGHDVAFIASPIADFFKSGRRFDTVSISNALHHLEGVEAILSGLRTIVNPGGVIIVNEMYADGLTPAQETQRLQHSFMADLHRKTGEYHRAPFTRKELDTMIDNAGLSVQHRFRVANAEAPVQKETGESNGIANRLQPAIDRAYPDGAPSDVMIRFDQIKKRAADIGIAPPPQLVFVCTSK